MKYKILRNENDIIISTSITYEYNFFIGISLIIFINGDYNNYI